MTTSPQNYPPETRRLLYEDKSGKVIGLDRVQLLDPVPSERFLPTRALLHSPDLYLVYQAALVLTAWGDPAGLYQIETMVDARVDRQMEFAPHRIYDYDNVYDEMAGAVDLFGLSSAEHQDDRVRILQKILALYGPCFFESKLKDALLDSDFSELLPDTQAALERALKLNRMYLASQLLPPLARWEGEAVRPLLERFSLPPSSREQAPDPRTNVAEALGYLPGLQSRQQLAVMAQSPETVIAEEAQAALSKLSGRSS